MEFFFLYNVLLLLFFSRRNLNLVVKRFLFFKLFTASFADVVVAPPFIYIDQVKSSLTDRIEISAQNSWVSKGGAFTGEIRSASCFLFSYSFVWMEWQLLVPSCKRPIKHNKKTNSILWKRFQSFMHLHINCMDIGGHIFQEKFFSGPLLRHLLF